MGISIVLINNYYINIIFYEKSNIYSYISSVNARQYLFLYVILFIAISPVI
jgi:hypothetical protein